MQGELGEARVGRWGMLAFENSCHRVPWPIFVHNLLLILTVFNRHQVWGKTTHQGSRFRCFTIWKTEWPTRKAHKTYWLCSWLILWTYTKPSDVSKPFYMLYLSPRKSFFFLVYLIYSPFKAWFKRHLLRKFTMLGKCCSYILSYYPVYYWLSIHWDLLGKTGTKHLLYLHNAWHIVMHNECWRNEPKWLVRLLEKLDEDFPGGPVVKTSHFHCRGHRFNSWLEN